MAIRINTLRYNDFHHAHLHGLSDLVPRQRVVAILVDLVEEVDDAKVLLGVVKKPDGVDVEDDLRVEVLLVLVLVDGQRVVVDDAEVGPELTNVRHHRLEVGVHDDLLVTRNTKRLC